MKVDKKINFCYALFVTVLAIYGLVSLYNGHAIFTSETNSSQNYITVSTYDQNALDEFLKKFPEKTISFKQSYIKDDTTLQFQGFKESNLSYIALLNNNHFENVGTLEGELPVHSHQILVTQRMSEITLSASDYPEIFQDRDDVNWSDPIYIDGKEYQPNGATITENGCETLTISVDTPQVDDYIYMNDEKYTITGVLMVQQEYDYDFPELFMVQDDFDMLTENNSAFWEGYHYFEISETDDVYKFLKGKNNGENDTYYDSSFEYNDETFNNLIEVKVEYLIGMIVVGLIIILFLNYNNIENNYQDYQMYHILGMSYQEIRKKQLWKSLHMAFLTYIPIVLYFVILIVFSIDHYMPICEVCGILLLIMIFYLIVYNVPLYLVFNNHKNEELRKGDE